MNFEADAPEWIHVSHKIYRCEILHSDEMGKVKAIIALSTVHARHGYIL